MTSIRRKLLLAFAALGLLGIASMAAIGWLTLRHQAARENQDAFRRAHERLEEAIEQRFAYVKQVANIAYTEGLIRNISSSATDESDFGLQKEGSDAQKLAALHQNIVDADWSWAQESGLGTFAIADYKGRVLYDHADSNVWGGDALVLPAVSEAMKLEGDHYGSMIAHVDDPRLAKLVLLKRDHPAGLVVIMARAMVFDGKVQACFIQLLDTDRLLMVPDPEITRVALVAPDGAADGNAPPAAIAAAMNPAMETASSEVNGDEWVSQAFPLPGLGNDARIGSFVLAQDLSQARQVLIAPTQVPLAAAVIVILILALGAALSMAERLARPIVALDAAARRVAAGDLEVTIPAPPRGDEIALLGRTFNTMIEGLRERERIKRTFKKYLPPDVVDYLLAHPEAQELGGTRKQLTVMFSDLVRFTSLSEGRPPEEVVGILNVYFTKVSEKIAARGGTVDKYIGDAIMAFFGAPQPLEDHATRACLSALDHLHVLDELSPRWKSGNWPELAVRIGINAGEMIIGNIGGGQAQDYTVIGDAVNLAERIEGANKEYGTRLLVTEAVWNAAHTAVDGREIDRVALVGRVQPVRVFEIFGEKGTLESAPVKHKAYARYAEGLALLRDRKFGQAQRAFADGRLIDPADAPAAIMEQRAIFFQDSPPPEGWDGVFHRTLK